MISAAPKGKLGYYCRKVDEMKPGERLDVDIRDLQDIESYCHNGAIFTPADRIFGNIAGSAYTHSYEVHPSGRYITFVRHEETGHRYYDDPDRR